jgi:hypothetical protein
LQAQFSAGNINETDFMLGLKQLGIEDPYNYLPSEDFVVNDFSKKKR